VTHELEKQKKIENDAMAMRNGDESEDKQ